MTPSEKKDYPRLYGLYPKEIFKLSICYKCHKNCKLLKLFSNIFNILAYEYIGLWIFITLYLCKFLLLSLK